MQKDEIYIFPKEAEHKLKTARKMKTPVYIFGVTGIGKTSLVKQVIMNRKYLYYSAADTDPEEIETEGDLKYQTIVIDDLNHITTPTDKNIYEKKIEKLLARDDIWLVLISRAPVPNWLISLYIQHLFVLIPEKDLYFTEQEQSLFLDQWGITLTQEEEKKVLDTLGGIPIALRIFCLRGGDLEQTIKDLCAYVENRVYGQWEMELQEFVMETSIVEKFDKELAVMITGRDNVHELLSRVEELGNFFVLAGKNGIWKYIPQLRWTMQQRIQKKYSQEKIHNLYYNAGLYYEIHGKTPDALAMYDKIKDAESISRVLVGNARKNPANGHYYELRDYYFALPEEKVMKVPVLMAGMSMLQSMLMNKTESERWYGLLESYAGNNTGSAAREAKNQLLYLDIALPHRGILRLTDILKKAGTLLKQRKAILPELSVTSNLPSMMNGGKDFCEWSKKDTELASGIGKIVEFVLGKHGKGLVSLALAESFLEKGENSYEVMRLAERGKMSTESGGSVEQSFVAIGILSWLAILSGNGDYALEVLSNFRKQAVLKAPNLLNNLEAFFCRIYLYQNKGDNVAEWLENAPEELSGFDTMERFRYLTKVRVYLMSGKYNQACSLLEQILYYAENMDRTYIRIEAQLLLSIGLYHMHDNRWVEMMQKSISQAEEYHFVRILTREGPAIRKLIKKEKFVWKDDKFRQQVMSECNQMAEFYPRYLDPGSMGTMVLPENALKILRLQAEGMSTRVIAEKLGLKEANVKYHCGETYRKLGVKSRTAAVNEARKRKLI